MAKISKSGRASALAQSWPVVCGICLAAPLWAATDTSEPVDPNALVEVIVTARRVEENLQRVPVATTVVDTATIENLQIRRASDLQFSAPSLTVVPDPLGGSGVPVFQLRGLSAPLGTDDTVITYFADVPVNAKALASGLYDLDSVQVLRGPQGTLFGKNSTGGAVIFTARQPDMHDLNGYVDLVYGSFNLQQYTGAVSLPVVDGKLAVRLSGQSAQQDGTVKNIHGLDGNDKDYTLGRIVVDFAPTEQLSDRLTVNYFDGRQQTNPPITTGLVSFGAFVPPYVAGLALQQSLGARTIANGFMGGSNPDRNISSILSNVTAYDAGAITIKNIVGFSHIDTHDAYNESSFDFPGVYVTQISQQHQWSDELQVSGTGLDEHARWIAGAFYSKQITDVYEQVNAFGDLGLPGTSADVYTTKAIYAQGTYGLERWKLTVGLRNSWDSRMADAIPPSTIEQIREQTSDSHLSWTLGLDFQATDQLLLYLASRHSYKAGGFNLTSAIPPNVFTYVPETLTDIEIGVKSTYQLGSVPIRTNLALYRGIYKNIDTQVAANCNNSGLASLTFNAQKGTPQGLELEFDSRPFQYLKVSGFYSLTTGKYNEFSLPPVPGCVLASSPELTGQQFGNISRNTGSVTATVDLPTPATIGAVSASLNAYSRSQRIGNDLSGFASPMPGYTVANFRVDVAKLAGTGITVGAYVKNLTDKLYGLTRNTSTLVGLDSTIYGDPRMYGVDLRYDF